VNPVILVGQGSLSICKDVGRVTNENPIPGKSLHLVIPDNIIKYLIEKYGDDIYFSLMHLPEQGPEVFALTIASRDVKRKYKAKIRRPKKQYLWAKQMPLTAVHALSLHDMVDAQFCIMSSVGIPGEWIRISPLSHRLLVQPQGSAIVEQDSIVEPEIDLNFEN